MIEKLNGKNLTNDELFYGHKACGGCGESLAVRLAMKILGERTFASLPAGCRWHRRCAGRANRDRAAAADHRPGASTRCDAVPAPPS